MPLDPHRYPSDPNVETAYLGQFTREHANEIAGRLEDADIFWWFKEPGAISALWECGVRMFVDRRRLDEARVISAEVTAESG